MYNTMLKTGPLNYKYLQLINIYIHTAHNVFHIRDIRVLLEVPNSLFYNNVLIENCQHLHSRGLICTGSYERLPHVVNKGVILPLNRIIKLSIILEGVKSGT
jgi:hypothetical protein